ncbi:hypothetical protein ACFL3D_01235 [Candidatus Omnitrophota bacterium]
MKKSKYYIRMLLLVFLMVSQVHPGALYASLDIKTSHRDIPSAATITSFMELPNDKQKPLSGINNNFLKAIRGKRSKLDNKIDSHVKVVSIELEDDHAGLLNEILKFLEPDQRLISYQTQLQKDNRLLLSLRIESDKPETLEQTMEKIRKFATTLVLEGVPLDKKTEQIYRESFYLSLHMPYNNKNLLLLTDIFAEFNLNIDSFLFPEYADEHQTTRFLWEVSIPYYLLVGNYNEDHFHELWNMPDHLRKGELIRRLDELMKELSNSIYVRCQGVARKSVVVDWHMSIAETLIDELLADLAVDLADDKERFLNAFKLISEKLTVLRKDQYTPYVVHLLKSVKILVNEFGIKDPKAVIAILLHDAVEDDVITFDELTTQLEESPDILRIVKLMTRIGEKKYMSEIEYLGDIAKEPGKTGCILKLAKIADRVQNFRSLNIGNDTFHRKVFFGTLNTFIPDFIEHGAMEIEQWEEAYRGNYTLARDTFFAEVILRGMRFGFINRNGKVSRRHLNLYLQEQSDYFEVTTSLDSALVNEIEKRTIHTFYQETIDKLAPFVVAMNASVELHKNLSEKKGYVYKYLLKNSGLTPFFPHRIKSSIVLFIHLLYKKYIVIMERKGLDPEVDILYPGILQDALSEVAVEVNGKSYLLLRITSSFIFLSKKRRSMGKTVGIFNQVFTEYRNSEAELGLSANARNEESESVPQKEDLTFREKDDTIIASKMTFQAA